MSARKESTNNVCYQIDENCTSDLENFDPYGMASRHMTEVQRELRQILRKNLEQSR